MNPLFRDMPLFVEVARNKSFSRAAARLDMYTSTLSRRIAALEKEVGVPLFLRTTRNVELTTGGKLLLERCEFLLAEADYALESVVGNMTRPAGPVRVSLFEYSYHAVLKGVFTGFAAKWPDVQLSVTFNDRPVDLLSEPYDVDFRVGPLPDSTLVARRVLTVEPQIFASPALLERYPMPEKPEDLATMPCLVLNRIGSAWRLHRGREQVVCSVRPRHVFSSISLCQEFVLAGQGVALLRKHLAVEDVKAGRLVRLLPEWTGTRHELFMVRAPGQPPKRVQVFMDYMGEFFDSLGQWE